MKGSTRMGRIGNTGITAALYLAMAAVPGVAFSCGNLKPAGNQQPVNMTVAMNHADGMDHSMHQMDTSAPAMDHSMHQMGNSAPAMDHSMHNMDHSAQGQAMPMGGEHAQHMQMMQRQGYDRSIHDYALSNIALVDMKGKQTTLQQELDTPMPVLLNFIYTTCTTICPVLSATFSQVQQDMGSDIQNVRMISITIDPEQDTPVQLRNYAERFHAGPQWRFLTGDLDNIIAVQKAFDIYRGAKTNHEPITLLRASGASEWVRVEGLASSAEIMQEFNALAAATR